MSLSRLPAVLALVLPLAVTGCHRASAKSYPLDVCIVSGEKLGNHGTPYVFERDGQQVKLCCEGCMDDFNASAGKLLKQLAEKSKP